MARLLRAGLALSLGSIAVMADIGSRSVVPGANDNLAAVGAVIALAQRLRDEPLSGARVLLVSTGSEESFSEGMSEFLARHGDELDPSRTELLCLECLGGARLVVVEGEGMLRMRDYPARCATRSPMPPPGPPCRSSAGPRPSPRPTRWWRCAPAIRS